VEVWPELARERLRARPASDSAQNPSTASRRARHRVGRPPQRPPLTLRYTAATILFRRGWNEVPVQKFLGHHSPAFTLAVYVHLLDDDLPEPTFLDELDVARAVPHCAEQLGKDVVDGASLVVAERRVQLDSEHAFGIEAAAAGH